MAAPDPAYTFTLPSLHDNIDLDCRLYHPTSVHGRHGQVSSTNLRGAILAHPYAPLGGSYDDAVVLSLVGTLIEQNYIVATFNFRGAGGSAGHTSWTGRPEVDDYLSVVGFLAFYVFWLSLAEDATTLTLSPSELGPERQGAIDLICGGYSYGALVVAKLPTIDKTLAQLGSAVPGTTESEIVMRARVIAKQTETTSKSRISQSISRGDSEHIEEGMRSAARVSAITVGGADAHPKIRARSGSAQSHHERIRKSIDIPNRIRAHIRGHSDDAVSEKFIPEVAALDAHRQPEQQRPGPSAAQRAESQSFIPRVQVSYVLVSPVMVPFTSALLPPGSPITLSLQHRGLSHAKTGDTVWSHPSMALFGSSDSFTSAYHLQAWAHKQAAAAPKTFSWEMIQGAGHFWAEAGVLQAMKLTILRWLSDRFKIDS